MKALQALETSDALHTREDIANLAKCFDLQGLHYVEVHAMQNFQTAMSHWPLLMETLQHSLLGYESIIKPLPLAFDD
jgi:hypothetical protein